MKANDLRAMAPPAAKAGFGLGWIAVQGAVCAAIAFGAYYVFSTPDLLPGSSSAPKASIAQQTIAVVARATAPTPPPALAPEPAKPEPAPSAQQTAASTVVTFLARTSPSDPTFAGCARVARIEPGKFFQLIVQGDPDAIARASDCYIAINPARLCEAAPRRDMLDVLTIYFATKRAQIAAERNLPGRPVQVAGRWDTDVHRAVRAKFRNAIAIGLITPEEVASFREQEMIDLAKDVKPGRKVCVQSAEPGFPAASEPPATGFQAVTAEPAGLTAAGAAAAVGAAAATATRSTPPAAAVTTSPAARPKPAAKPAAKTAPAKKKKRS
jgi:hypothetical protein